MAVARRRGEVLRSRALIGRQAELEHVSTVLALACSGEGRALLVRGEPGAGVTSLLDAAVSTVPADVRLIRLSGLPGEVHGSGAALERLAAHFPGSEIITGRDLHGAVVGGPPVAIVIDDAQWLDQETINALTFCCHRLIGVNASLVLGVSALQRGGDLLAGVPAIDLDGLNAGDATVLLRRLAGVPVAQRVARDLVQSVAGNAGALCALAEHLGPRELAGHSPLPDPVRPGRLLEDAYAAPVRALPQPTQRALAAVAVGADTVERLAAVSRTADLALAALDAAVDAWVVDVRDGRVVFTHPLVRSATYYLTPAEERRELAVAIEEAARGVGAGAVDGGTVRVRIQLLGGFDVVVDGESAPLAHGVATQAVKAVALHTELPVDVLAEMLWPGAGPGVGRLRLRNVLSRTRVGAEPLLRRDGDLIRLWERVSVDAGEFLELADKALVASMAEVSARQQLEHAVERYVGELLPADRYLDWTSAPRERLARRWLQLLDALAEVCVADADVPRALQLLQTAIEVDPLDETRYVRGAEILAAQEQASLAIGLLRRGAAALESCGLPLSQHATALMNRLTGNGPVRIAPQKTRDLAPMS